MQKFIQSWASLHCLPDMDSKQLEDRDLVSFLFTLLPPGVELLRLGIQYIFDEWMNEWTNISTSL